jgi:hypothetical protein
MLPKLGKLGNAEIEVPGAAFSESAWRPVLRGIRSDDRGAAGSSLHYRELTEAGIIDFAWIDVVTSDEIKRFPLDEVIWSAAFVLLWIELIRTKCGSPDLPFGLSLSLVYAEAFVPVLSLRHPQSIRYRDGFPGRRTRLPTYRVADQTEFPSLLDRLAHDFFNAGGTTFEARMALDLSPALARMNGPSSA